MSESQCDVCIPDEDHRRAMVALTHARLQAIQTARRVIVLSHYMAECLAGKKAGAGLDRPHLVVRKASAQGNYKASNTAARTAAAPEASCRGARRGAASVGGSRAASLR